MNFFNLFLTIIFSYIFISYLDFRELGFVYTKTLQELITFLLIVYIWRVQINDEIKILPEISRIKKNILKFSYKCLESATSLAMMTMGFEVCTYCAARMNVNELATWILFVYI